MNKPVPAILYKYRAFSINSLDSLINDTVYLADPITFNDPFDCQPYLVNDVKEIHKLREITASLMFETQAREIILRKDAVMDFLEYKHTSKLKSAPLSLGLYNETPLQMSDKFRKESRKDYTNFRDLQIEQLRTDIYDFLDHLEQAYAPESEHIMIGKYEDLIKDELKTSPNLGVLSLAKENDCPLMWSHYGDHHKGFCCGLRLPGKPQEFALKKKIKAVDYKGTRKVLTSQLYTYSTTTVNVRNAVHTNLYYAKANKWKYEKEYRMIGDLGLQNSPFILESIYFGLRCKDAVKLSVMSALAKRTSPVNFFQMVEVDDGFRLEPKPITLYDIKNLPITCTE